MSRDNLKRAREHANLTQKELADKIGVDRSSVIAWEAGKRKIQMYYRRRIREILKNDDPELFDIVETPPKTEDQTTCMDTSVSDRLDSSDSLGILESEEEEEVTMDPRRRKFNGTVVAGIMAVGTGATLVNSTQAITAPVIEHEVYIDSVKGNIGNWWHWLNTGNYSELELKLSMHVPVLKGIATTVSPFRKRAASLAVQAKIMQVRLATRNLEFSQRESYCLEAIQFGEISGDRNLLALAQFWYGDTFTYCYNQPQTAIQHLNDALSNVAGNPLIATRIYSDLSIAHAQIHDETNALEYAKLAYSTMPSYPALDNRLHDVGHAELDQKIGKAYLCLAEYLPKRYARKAYNAFDKSTGKQASRKGYRRQALIRKADAARVLGEKDECVTCLTQAYENMSGVEQLTQIQDVLHRVPDEWKSETDVQELQQDVHALVVARQ